MARRSGADDWLARQQRWLQSGHAALLGLVVAGVLVEISLVWGWLGAVSLSGHPGFPAEGQDPLVWLLGQGPHGVNHFLALLAAVFLPYLLALALAGRVSGRAGVGIALGGAVLFGLTMLAAFPAGAIDIFHNIMDGRLVWIYHLNPITVPPMAVSQDPLFRYLHYWQGQRSAYGPLWFLLTGPAVLAAGDGLTSNIIAYKTLSFAFELISLALIALIVRRLSPARITAAIVCFGWNPLVLWEFAGNGHNDIVMMTFVLLALLLLLTKRWPLAFPALVCSMLVKWVSAVLLPVFVLWVLWRHGRKALLPLALGMFWAVALGAIVIAPFWSGRQTFEQLRNQQNYFIFSPASALVGNWGETLSRTSHVQRVTNLLRVTFTLLFGLSLLRLRRSPVSLVRASVEVMFLFLVLMTWWFWPWYVVWGLALAALLPGTDYARLCVLFSATAMLVYVVSPWRTELWNFDSSYPFAIGAALLIFLPPVLYAAVQIGGRPAADSKTDRP